MNTIEFLSNLRQYGVQIWAESGQLRYRAPKGTLPANLLDELRQRKDEILAFLDKAAAATRPTLPPIRPVPRDGPLPLSFAQQRLWFLDQLAPGLTGYNIATVVRLTGQLDVAALQQSFNALIARHEVLRTTFASSAGEPVQVIAPQLSIELPVSDLRDLAASEQAVQIDQHTTAVVDYVFDLAKGPLLHARLLCLADEEHLLLCALHHIIADGWSSSILVRDLATYYGALISGQPVALNPLPIQYADFAVWQRQYLQGERLERQLAYWKQQLGNDLPLLDLPSDRPHPPIQTFNGAYRSRPLPTALAAALRSLAQQEEVTLFMLLLAAFQVLLLRYSGQDDIVVGSPIANRNRREVEELIGFFVNTLVLRSDLSGNPSFRTALQRVRELCLGAYAHQDLPFERLVEELRPQRDLSRHPLFQVVFVLQNTPPLLREMAALTMQWQAPRETAAKFDLTLLVNEIGSDLSLVWEYNTDIFDAATIERMGVHFQTLLEGIVADPQSRLGDLPLLSPAEVQQIVHAWAPSLPDLPFQPVAACVAGQAARDPAALAIQSGATQLSYAALDRAANQLAHALQAAGVGAECCVALCFERSPELVVAALAVLKAGGAFLPLDPATPPTRLSQLLRAARPTLLLNTALLSSVPDDLPSLLVDLAAWHSFAHWPTHAPAVQPQPDQLAYLIYTSGSTGQPKAVQLTQRNLAALVAWHTMAFALGPHDRCTLLANPAFDASVWEIWPVLAAGASLHLPAVETRLDATQLRDWLLAEHISVSFVPTPLAEQLLTLPWPATAALRLLLTGGDRLRQMPPPGLPFTLINNYGPTEGTVLVTSGAIAPTAAATPAPPDIGAPIATAQLYVLDRFGQPVPQGVVGELYLGGLGLARGYQHRPDLTAEKFVPHPFATEPGARLYRTGDRVRWQSDGRLAFVGRADDQVKIRGVRVEPGEVAAVLGQHPQVQTALVLAQPGPSGEGQLLAYVVLHPAARASGLPAAALRAYLVERLPAALVPSAFVLLEALPLTPNGKIDRKALPLPDQHEELAANYVAPRTPLEEHLAEIWAKVLKLERVGVEDNFFVLGGHSLLATQIVAQIRAHYTLNIALHDFFVEPTIANLARHIEVVQHLMARNVSASAPLSADEMEGEL